MADDDTVTTFDEVQRAVPAKRPWWVSSRGLGSAIALGAGWTGMFILRFADVLEDPSAFNICIVVLSGLLAASFVPTIIYFAKLRQSAGAQTRAIADDQPSEPN